MFPAFRYIITAATVAAAVPSIATAQDSTTADRVRNAMVLNHTFNAAIGEQIHLFLAKGIDYRVEVDGTGVSLQLRTMDNSVQEPLIEPLLNGPSAAGVSIYTVKPRADAEYIFTTSGGIVGNSVKLLVRANTPKPPKPAKP